MRKSTDEGAKGMPIKSVAKSEAAKKWVGERYRDPVTKKFAKRPDPTLEVPPVAVSGRTNDPVVHNHDPKYDYAQGQASPELQGYKAQPPLGEYTGYKSPPEPLGLASDMEDRDEQISHVVGRWIPVVVGVLILLAALFIAYMMLR